MFLRMKTPDGGKDIIVNTDHVKWIEPRNTGWDLYFNVDPASDNAISRNVAATLQEIATAFSVQVFNPTSGHCEPSPFE